MLITLCVWFGRPLVDKKKKKAFISITVVVAEVFHKNFSCCNKSKFHSHETVVCLTSFPGASWKNQHVMRVMFKWTFNTQNRNLVVGSSKPCVRRVSKYHLHSDSFISSNCLLRKRIHETNLFLRDFLTQACQITEVKGWVIIQSVNCVPFLFIYFHNRII